VQIFSLKIQCTVILDTMNLKNCWGGLQPPTPPLVYTLVIMDISDMQQVYSRSLLTVGNVMSPDKAHVTVVADHCGLNYSHG